VNFILQHTNAKTNARAGLIITEHGVIETPIFIPVGTKGVVKAVHISELEKDIYAKIILSNTYHLYLRPGIEILERSGGLHNFSGWKYPILTDSGGFQLFSLSSNCKIKQEGVEFRSHIDGSKHFFSPEKIIDVQRSIGADIIMAFDECIPSNTNYEYAKKSLTLTENWLDRCLYRFARTKNKYGYSQSLFPIVHGCIYKDLRVKSAEYVASKMAEGNAIGGLSMGETKEKMYEIIEIVNSILPKDKPRYLMGVGTPENILEGIERGIDMFDCIMPTRNGRNGQLFTKMGVINIKNKKWATDFSPIEIKSELNIDKIYTKAYLHHLFFSNEILALQISSIHNLAFYLWLVKEARKHIIIEKFSTWKQKMLINIQNKL
jgi:queuine tRNA-ribosyltransferase